MAVNTIILKGGNHQIEVTLDAIASPGMAIELAADGKYDPVASAQAEAPALSHIPCPVLSGSPI